MSSQDWFPLRINLAVWFQFVIERWGWKILCEVRGGWWGWFRMKEVGWTKERLGRVGGIRRAIRLWEKLGEAMKVGWDGRGWVKSGEARQLWEDGKSWVRMWEVRWGLGRLVRMKEVGGSKERLGRLDENWRHWVKLRKQGMLCEDGKSWVRIWEVRWN